RDRQLAAWVVPQPGRAPAAADLRAFLKARLPEYMVPAGFSWLDALPLTPTEELMAGIWAEVLRLPRVGVDRDFFALGGHSLLATRVVSRLREVFGVELPLRRLFEATTVAALAREVEAAQAAGRGIEAPPILPFPGSTSGIDLPLSFAQERLWF